MRKLCCRKTGIHPESYHIGVMVDTQVFHISKHIKCIKLIYIIVCELYPNEVN